MCVRARPQETRLCVFLHVTQMIVCVNVHVAAYFIVTLICGRLHQVSGDIVNL